MTQALRIVELGFVLKPVDQSDAAIAYCAHTLLCFFIYDNETVVG